MGQERDHERHRFGRGPQAVQGRAFRGGKRLPALRATEPPSLARMDTKIALACLASSMAIQIGGECRCGVHDSPRGFARIGYVPKGVRLVPGFPWKGTSPRLNVELPIL